MSNYFDAKEIECEGCENFFNENDLNEDNLCEDCYRDKMADMAEQRYDRD